MAQSASQKLFQKALYLSVALIVVAFVATFLYKTPQKNGHGKHMRIITRNSNVAILNDGEKDPVKKKIAGFWYCSNVVDDDIPCLKVSDRIELKQNGIFWRVLQKVITLPNNDSLQFTHVMTGYMDPFSFSKKTPDSLTFEVHIIGQVMIAGNDTCFGDSKVDTVWDAFANGSRFSFSKIEYRNFDTAGAAIFSFFPKGAIKLIQKITLNQCHPSFSMENFARSAIIGGLRSQTVEKLTKDSVDAIIKRYYKGMFAKPLAKWITINAPGSVSLSFLVNATGSVENVKMIHSKPRNLKLNKELETEISTWAFPKSRNMPAPLQIVLEFSF